MFVGYVNEPLFFSEFGALSQNTPRGCDITTFLHVLQVLVFGELMPHSCRASWGSFLSFSQHEEDGGVGSIASSCEERKERKCSRLKHSL